MTRFLRDHLLVICTAALAAVFLMTGPVTPPAAMRAIDSRVLLVLFALLITVEILRASGRFDLVVGRAPRSTSRSRPGPGSEDAGCCAPALASHALFR